MNKKNKNILDQLKLKDSGFTVPDGYFQNLELPLESDKPYKETGFKVPNSYFKNVENEILTKTTKSTGYQIPKGYFDHLEPIVLSKTIYKKKSKIRSVQFLKFASYAAAASILLFFGVQQWSNKQQFDINSISAADIENWMDNGFIHFQTEEISETLEDIDLIALNNFSQEDIQQYLNEEDLENLMLETE